MDIKEIRGEGFSKEKNDCVVVALMNRIKTSYTRAHEIVAAFRADGKACNKANKMLESVELVPTLYCRSLRQFLIDHKTGCHFVAKHGHAFTVDQGKVINTFKMGLNTKVIYYA